MKSFNKFLVIAAVALAATCAAAAASAGIVDAKAIFTPDVIFGLAAAGMALSTNAVQDGCVIDWVNGSGAAVASGDVVKMGNLLGVALVDIASGATGSVCIRGVFTVPKVAGAVIAQGESLTWDVSAAKFDDNAAVPASGDVTGASAVAFEAAGNGVTEIDVYFTGAPGTVTA